MTTSYDSAPDTKKHINRVQTEIEHFTDRLKFRAMLHDKSKLTPIEKETFDEVTPLLKNLTYGSEEYTEQMNKMKTALDHHYTSNSHQPEHYAKGVRGMNLVDIVEMVCDWKAASERHTDGNFLDSIKHNKERFNISDDLYDILYNTGEMMGWLVEE